MPTDYGRLELRQWVRERTMIEENESDYCGEKTCCYAFKEGDNPNKANWLRVKQNFELVSRVTDKHKILDKMIKVKVRRIKQ